MSAATNGSPPLGDWLRWGWDRPAVLGAVPVEGATVRYRAWGLDDRARPGLMFVHGFLAHARWWDHIAPRFADRFRVVAPDFTGMGDSDRRPDYSRRQYARETLAVIEAAGLERVTLVAHSFGAVSSLYAAKIAPERIARVIVIDAHVFRAEEARSVGVYPEKVYADRAEALARYRLTPGGAWPNPQILAYIAEASLRESASGWGWKFDPEVFRTVHKERIRDEIRDLPVAIDFIHAGDSEIVGPAELAAFAANAPTCGAPVVVPLCHHHIMIEQPLGLVAALNGLLANDRSGPQAGDRAAEIFDAASGGTALWPETKRAGR